MSRFKRIKNKTTKKSSVSIDEKIAALNKELEKTGMLSERMTTSNVYSTSTFVPADPGGEFPIPDTTGVTGSGFTQPVSGDPNDPSNWPNAYTDNSWMRNSNNVNGEANQPIIASFDDALFATDTSGRYPTGGAGIAFGNQAFGVSVGYIRNGFYHQVLKPGLLGGTVTVPQDASGAPYFGLFGEYFPADETRQKILKMASARYAAVNVAGATTIPVKAWTPHNTFHMGPFADYSGPKVTVDGQNYVLQTFQMYTKSNTFYVNATPATTTNPIFRGIGDIEYHGPITPGRLFGLSNQGYNYLDGRSKKKKEDEGTFDADGNYIPPGFENRIGTDEIIRRLGGRTVRTMAGGGVSPRGIGTGNTYSFTTGPRLQSAQPVADPTTTTQTQQSPPEESEPPNIPAPQSPPDKPFSTSNPTPPPDIPPLPAPKPQPGNYEGRPGRILDPTGLDQRAIELGYNDELYPANPDRFYTTQVELGQSILSARMDAEYYGALSRGESPNYDNASINKAKADLAKYRKNLDNWNRWKQNTGYMWRGAVKDTAYDQQKAAEKDLKDKKLQNEIDKLKADQAINDAAAEVYAAEARALLVKFGFDVALNIFGGLLAGKIMTLTALQLGKIPAVANFFKLSKAQQAARIAKASKASSSAAKTAKTGNLSSALRGAADDIIDNLDDIIMKTDSSQALKFKDALIDAVDAGDEQAIRRIVQQIKNSKFKNQVPTGGVDGKINIPKSTKSNLHQPFGNPKSGLDPGARYDLLMQSYESKGKLLNEAAKLGHFEPEELNVDIEKLRKGIMPEYPKKPPAKMIDGYHQDSKLKPKELNKEPYLKIDEKDLIRNHRLKPNEAQEMMQTIDRINDHIKEHPEDLIHAQMRYPIDDPRLAELNWRMDQMLDAGEEYLDSNFKVNDKLFKRAVDRTKNNIKLTDPEYVQQNYNELRGTTQGKIINPKPRDIKLKSKLKKYLPQYESKSFFKHVDSNDYKKISQRKEEQKKLKLANETILNKVTKERQEYIDGEMSKQMSDWRKDISESDFTNITKGNKVGQTFQHASGATITLDNTMSDPSDQPSQVTLDLGFGEKITVDAPSGNEYGIAGVTKPLDKKVMQKQSVKTAKEINDQIDASEKASESKSARVPIETGDLGYKSTDQILAEVGDQWTYEEYMDQLNALSDRYAKISEPLEKVKLDYIYNKLEEVPIAIVDAIDAITKALHQAQEALHQAWERYNKIPDQIGNSEPPKSYMDIWGKIPAPGGFGGGQGNPTNRRGSGFDTQGALDSSGYGMNPARDTETESRPDEGEKPIAKSRRSNYTPQEIAQNRENLKNSIVTTATGVIDGARNLNRVNYALNLAKRQSAKSGGSTQINTIPSNSLGGRNNPVETKMHFQSKKAFIKSIDLNNTDKDIASQIVDNSADAAQYALGFKAVHSQIPTEGGSQENNVKLNSKGDLEMFDNYAFRPDGYMDTGIAKAAKFFGGTELQKDAATLLDKAGPVGWLSHALLGDIPDRQDPSVRIKTTITKKELIQILGAEDYKIFVNRMKKERKKRKVNESTAFSKIKKFRNK